MKIKPHPNDTNIELETKIGEYTVPQIVPGAES